MKNMPLLIAGMLLCLVFVPVRGDAAPPTMSDGPQSGPAAAPETRAASNEKWDKPDSESKDSNGHTKYATWKNGNSWNVTVDYAPQADVNISGEVFDDPASPKDTTFEATGENKANVHYIVEADEEAWVLITVANTIVFDYRCSPSKKPSSSFSADMKAVDIHGENHQVWRISRFVEDDHDKAGESDTVERLGSETTYRSSSSANVPTTGSSRIRGGYSTHNGGGPHPGTRRGTGEGHNWGDPAGGSGVSRETTEKASRGSTNFKTGFYVYLIYDQKVGKEYGPKQILGHGKCRWWAKSSGAPVPFSNPASPGYLSYSDASWAGCFGQGRVKNDAAGHFIILPSSTPPPTTTPPSNPGDSGVPWGDPPTTDPTTGAGEWRVTAQAAFDQSGPNAQPLVAAGDVLASIHTTPGIGTGGQVGARDATVAIYLGEPHDADLEFSLSATPSSAASLPSTMVIPAGDQLALDRYEVLQTGAITVTATLTKVDGVTVTPEDFSVSDTNAAFADLTEPEIGIGLDGDPRERPSVDVGSFRIFRSGFDDFDTEATVVSITTSDPSGILVAPPTSATILAGDEFVDVLVTRTSNVGEATIEFSYGTQTESVEIETIDQAMSTMGDVRLPVGGKLLLPVYLALPADGLRDVSVAGAGSMLTLGSSTISLDDGERRSSTTLEGSAVGTGTLQLSSAGLSSVDVPFEVVATEVTMSRTRVTLDDLAGSQAAVVELVAPEGATFEQIQVPTGSASWMTVTTEDERLFVTFTDGVARPTTVDIDFVLGGTVPTGSFDVVVDDGLRASDWVYAVEVP